MVIRESHCACRARVQSRQKSIHLFMCISPQVTAKRETPRNERNRILESHATITATSEFVLFFSHKIVRVFIQNKPTMQGILNEVVNNDNITMNDLLTLGADEPFAITVARPDPGESNRAVMMFTTNGTALCQDRVVFRPSAPARMPIPFDPDDRWTATRIRRDDVFDMPPQGYASLKVSNWFFNPKPFELMDDTEVDITDMQDTMCETNHMLQPHTCLHVLHAVRDTEFTAAQLLDLLWKCKYTQKTWVPNTLATFTHAVVECAVIRDANGRIMHDMWRNVASTVKKVDCGTCPNCLGCGPLYFTCKRCPTLSDRHRQGRAPAAPSAFGHVKLRMRSHAHDDEGKPVEVITLGERMPPHAPGDLTNCVEPCCDFTAQESAKINFLHNRLCNNPTEPSTEHAPVCELDAEPVVQKFAHIQSDCPAKEVMNKAPELGLTCGQHARIWIGINGATNIREAEEAHADDCDVNMEEDCVPHARLDLRRKIEERYNSNWCEFGWDDGDY